MKNATIHQFGFVVCLWALGLASDTSGQDCLLQDNGCLYSVEGNCIPRRTTYGYYQTHWRTWPNAQPPRIPKMKKRVRRSVEGSTLLPEAEVPRAKDEAAINPRLPTSPDEVAPADSKPATQLELDRATDPFQDDLSPGDNRDDIETPLEDDLDIPPDSSSNAVRLDGQRISQLQRPRSTVRLDGTEFHRNPLRRHASSQAPVHLLPATSAMMRPVSHEAPVLRQQGWIQTQPPVNSSAANPLRFP